MAIIALQDLQDSEGPLLGIDPGTKTLGQHTSWVFMTRTTSVG